MIKDNEQIIENLKDIRNTIYSTSHKKLNYKALAQEIKELRKPYEY